MAFQDDAPIYIAHALTWPTSGFDLAMLSDAACHLPQIMP